MSHLKDKVILITGGTSGIGLACTELFARHGAKVVTMSIQAEEGKALAKRLTGRGLQLRLSLRRREQGAGREGGRRSGRLASSAGWIASTPTPACCGTRRSPS